MEIIQNKNSKGEEPVPEKKVSSPLDKEKAVLSRLQRQCAKGECCENDILRKALKALDGDGEAAQRVVDSLKGDGFLDNRRYASAYARDKASLSGWGAIKISHFLRAKGVSKEDIDAALLEIDPSSAKKKLHSTLLSKYKTLKGEKDVKLRLLRFALQRGYSYDEVRDEVEEMIKNENTED